MGILTTLLGELHTAVNAVDWTTQISGGADVEKKWRQSLASHDLDATKPLITVAPGDLLLTRETPDSFSADIILAVLVRGRAATEERCALLCDFAESVAEVLTDVALSQPIVTIETKPLVHLEVLRQENVWYSLFLVHCGPPHA